MADIEISVDGGTSKRLLTAGKYCDRDILVSASGGAASPVIEPLEVTTNGTYTAPAGVDGYSPVTVNVSGGGGETGGNIYLNAVNSVKECTIIFSDNTAKHLSVLSSDYSVGDTLNDVLYFSFASSGWISATLSGDADNLYEYSADAIEHYVFKINGECTLNDGR